MAIRAQYRKIGGDIVMHRDALFQRADWFEVVRFNEPLTDFTIPLRKTKMAGLAARTMKLLAFFVAVRLRSILR